MLILIAGWLAGCLNWHGYSRAMQARAFLRVKFSDRKPFPIGVVIGAFSPILCFCTHVIDG